MTNKLATPPSSYATLPAGVTMFFRRNENFWVNGHIGMDNGRAEMTQPSCYLQWRYHENRYQQFLALPMWERVLKGSEKEQEYSQKTLREFCDSQKEYNKELINNLRTNFCELNQKVVKSFAAIFPLAVKLSAIDLYGVMEVGVVEAFATDPVTYHDIKYDNRISRAVPILKDYYYDCNHRLSDARDYAETLELLAEFCAAMEDRKDLLHPYVTEMYQGLDDREIQLATAAREIMEGCRCIMLVGLEKALRESLVAEQMRLPITEFLFNHFKDGQADSAPSHQQIQLDIPLQSFSGRPSM
jgi:hypothetical protein